MIVIGTPADGGSAGLFDASLTGQLIRHARSEVHLVPIMPDRQLTAADQRGRRDRTRAAGGAAYPMSPTTILR